MQKIDLHKIFKKLNNLDPPSNLKDSIFLEINLTEKKEMRKKRISAESGFFVSIVFCIWMIFTYGSAILNSEFANLISLLFSDLNVVFSNFQNYAMSLLETLPVLSLIMLLIPIFTLLLSLNYYFNFQNSRRRYQFI